MIGSLLGRAGMGASPFDFSKHESTPDPATESRKLAAQTEKVRLKAVAAQLKATTAAQRASRFGQWTPLIVVGALLGVGAIVLVVRSRRKRP